METQEETRPWEQMVALLDSDASVDAADVRDYIETLAPGETARALSRLAEDERLRLFSRLGPEYSADLMVLLHDAQTADIIEEMPATDAAAILQEMPSDDRVDILGEMEDEDADAILAALEPDDATSVREMLAYDPETAGGMMIREFLAYPEHWKISEVLDDLRANRERYSDFDVQYAYIVTEGGALSGVLRMRDLVLARPDEAVRSIMLPEPMSIPVTSGLQELWEFFHDHRFFGVPVVDDTGKMLGIVRRTAVEEATADRASDDFLKMSGVSGGEEFRNMPLRERSFRRLSWLSINIVLNLIAASVIALYTETLDAVIALAVFLPIISDMSGCSGNQAVAVSIRELTLGLVRPFEFVRVFMKEASIGLINGTVLGFLLGTLAFLWKGNPWLGAVVGGALLLNTIVAVVLGGLIPLVLKRFGYDAALASGPILTTVTDMCGFFLCLSLATAALSKIAM